MRAQTPAHPAPRSYLLLRSLRPARPQGGPRYQSQTPHQGPRQAPCLAVTCNLQPPTSTLEGGMAPVPHREESSRANRQMRQRLQKQGRGHERGAGESGRPSWRRQQEEGGSRRVTGWGRQDYRTMGEGPRVMTGGEKVLSPDYRRGTFVSLPQRHVGILTCNVMVLGGGAFG